MDLLNLFGRLGGFGAIASRLTLPAVPAKMRGEKYARAAGGGSTGSKSDAKPVADLTAFEVTHTADMMGPLGFSRAMLGTDATTSGDITKPVADWDGPPLVGGVAKDSTEDVMSTYIWAQKNTTANRYVYNIDIVYGMDAEPPRGYRKIETTLTPQLPEDRQAFLCVEIRHEDQDAGDSDEPSTEDDGLDQTQGEELVSPISPLAVASAPDLPQYGLSLDALGPLIAIIARPARRYTKRVRSVIIPLILAWLFGRFGALRSAELSSVDMKALETDCFLGMMRLMHCCLPGPAIQAAAGQTAAGQSAILSALSSMDPRRIMAHFRLNMAKTFLTTIFSRAHGWAGGDAQACGQRQRKSAHAHQR